MKHINCHDNSSDEQQVVAMTILVFLLTRRAGGSVQITQQEFNEGMTHLRTHMVHSTFDRPGVLLQITPRVQTKGETPAADEVWRGERHAERV